MAREEARARELGASYDEGRAAAREASVSLESHLTYKLTKKT